MTRPQPHCIPEQFLACALPAARVVSRDFSSILRWTKTVQHVGMVLWSAQHGLVVSFTSAFALPDFPISPWDGIRDPQPGRISWSLLAFLAVSNAEPCFVQKIDLSGLIFTGALLTAACLFYLLVGWLFFFFFLWGGVCSFFYKLNFVCWQTIGDKQNGLLACSAQAHQLWSQTYILQGRRWKIFIGSEIQFQRTFLRPRAFKLGQSPSHVWLRTLKLDWPIK